MSTRAGDARAAYPLFPVGNGGSIPTPALRCKHLWFYVIEQDRAKELNRLWHSRFPELGGGASRACYAAEAGGVLYAVAVWTNPTSPKLPQMTWLLLKRFAIADDKPKNTASRMMGWMIRDIRQRFPAVETLVSYSDPDSHSGTIYRSAGWTHDGETIRDETGWKNRPREHTENTPCRRVVRWLYRMRPLKYQTKQQRLVAIFDAYITKFKKSAATTEEVATWATQENLWPVPTLRGDGEEACLKWEEHLASVESK